MYEAFKTEIARLANWVKSAKLADESRVLWCLARLAPAYRELSRTYESRYAEEITRHEQAALTYATQESARGASFHQQLLNRFQSLNERFGLSKLPTAKVPPAPVAKKVYRKETASKLEKS